MSRTHTKANTKDKNIPSLAAMTIFKRMMPTLLILIISTGLFTGCSDPLKAANEAAYQAASELFNQGLYEEAAAAYDEIAVYRDSRSRRNEARAKLVEILNNNAMEIIALEDNGEYEKAIEYAVEVNDFFSISRLLYDAFKRTLSSGNSSGHSEPSGSNQPVSEPADLNQPLNISEVDRFISLLSYVIERIPNQVTFSENLGYTYSRYHRDTNEGYSHYDEVIITSGNIDFLASKLYGFNEYTRAISLLDMLPNDYSSSYKMNNELLINKDMYKAVDSALTEFKNGNNAAAVSSLEMFVGDNEDISFIINAIKAYDLYRNGEWFNAAHAFRELLEITHRENVYQELLEIMADKTQYERPVTPYENVTKRFPTNMIIYGLYNDCVNYYYEEEFAVSNNLSKVLQYKPELYFIGCQDWALERNNNLKQKLINRNLHSTYIMTARSTAAINVLSDKWYVENEKLQDTSFLMGVFSAIPPYYIAEEPEQIRYVLIYRFDYEYYGAYNNGTKGYSAITTLMLKDAVTGEILVNQSNKTNPPSRVQSFNVSNDTYATFHGFDLENVLADYLPKRN